MSRKILAPLDASKRAEGVLAFLPPFVASAGTEVTLLHVIPKPDEKAEPKAREYLQEIAKRLRGLKAKVIPRVVCGDPAVKITQEADSIAADLVALSTHGHTGQPERYLGDFSAALCHSCPSRILLVHPKAEPHNRQAPVAVCPIDSVVELKHLEGELEALFADTKATVHLLRIGRPFQWSLGGIAPVPPRATQEMEREVIELAARLKKHHVHIESEVVRGDPIEETLQAFERVRADMVLAQTSRILLFGWRLGELATRMIADHRIPVVLLR